MSAEKNLDYKGGMKMKTLKVSYIGKDDWGRRCYQNVDNPKRIYKDVNNTAPNHSLPLRLHTSSPDYGEPECLLKNPIILV